MGAKAPRKSDDFGKRRPISPVIFLPGVSFSLPVPFCAFSFANGVAEVAQLSSQRKVFSVGVCQKAALLQIQLALAVQKGFFHIDTSDFCFKYGVRP